MKDAELFQKIHEIIASGWSRMPDEHQGTGAPGLYLEQLVGLSVSSSDTPDAGRWELKYCSGSALLTLLHKTPQPRGSVRYLIEKFGWKGQNGRPSFRHTIKGKSDRGFKIVPDGESVLVAHPEHTGPVPHWSSDVLINHFGGKLRRLLVVRGERKKRQVRYLSVTAYQEFLFSGFLDALASGLIAVDFDAYLKESGAVRDHGTKFRVSPNDIGKLYKEQYHIH